MEASKKKLGARTTQLLRAKNKRISGAYLESIRQFKKSSGRKKEELKYFLRNRIPLSLYLVNKTCELQTKDEKSLLKCSNEERTREQDIF